MSDEKVEVQDVKQDTANTASEEKQSVEAVPYARFKELVDERNTFKSELSSLKNQIDEQTKERKQKDLEARGEYDKVITDMQNDLSKYKTKAEAFDSYQTNRREALLSQLSEDDRDIYADMNLEKLEAHVSKVAQRPVAVAKTAKAGSADFGGYNSMSEFALNDPKGYKKMRTADQKKSVWNTIFDN
jgi:DNA repair exonuclease SbcCD ATPase subunit